MLKLRGHHLICLHFFRGEGYSPAFVTELANMVKKAEEGEDIGVLAEADDVCTICPYLTGKKCSYTREADLEIRAMDARALDLLELNPAGITRWAALREKVPLIFQIWSREYCEECSWRRACEHNPFFNQLRHEKTAR